MGRKILLIGIGRSGCTVAELFLKKMNKDGLCASSIAIDTDEADLSGLKCATPIPMVEKKSLFSVVEALGADNICDWFPCDWERDRTEFIKNLRMDRGSNQWRMKAFLSFAAFLSKGKNVDSLHGAIDSAIKNENEFEEVELYVVASLAGGTGSALFLPVALYVKKYIEGMGGKIKNASAILAMPDVYEGCFTAEQKIKSYANAYAALREYNAVLLSTNGSENVSNHPPINFKLGVKGGAPDLLFDADDPDFQRAEANPFNQVYLFERVPNVLSVDTHLDILTDIVLSVCDGQENADVGESENLKTFDAIFGGMSLVNVKYPIESIVDYIAKKQIYDCFALELGRVHKRVMAEFDRKRGEARLYGFLFEGNVGQYSEAFISACDDIIYEEESKLSIIGRDKERFENDVTADNALHMDYLAQLNAMIEESIACDSSKELYELFHPPVEQESDEEQSEEGEKKRKSKKKAKKQRIKRKSSKQIAEDALAYGEKLKDFYRVGLRKLKKGGDGFAEGLFGDKTDTSEFSILTKLITNDGEYLHPIFSLLRLCLARREIEMLAKAAMPSFLDVDDIEKAEIPLPLTNASSSVSRRSNYVKLGENRFRALAFGSEGSAVKIADDEPLFLFDLEEAYTKLKTVLKAYRYKAVLETVEGLIQKYRRFIDVLSVNVAEDILDELKLSLKQGCSDNGVVVNVGASEHEKTVAWNEYMNGYVKNTDLICEYTAYMGERVYAAINAYDSNGSVRETIFDVINGLERLFRRQCQSSEFYAEKLEKNILEAVLDSSKDHRTGTTVSKVFKSRGLPLHIKMPEATDEYRAVKSTTRAVLGESVKDYLKEIASTDDSVTYVQRLMFDAGEYCGEAEFSEYIPQKEMLLQTRLSFLCPYFINVINELDESAEGYQAYLKALAAKDSLQTKMWDPHLIYSREENLQLPYINPKMQKQYEFKVARAIIMALWSADLRISEYEDAGEIFVIQNGMEIQPLVLDGEKDFIEKNRADRLIRWAYTNSEWVAEYSAKLENIEQRETTSVPAIRSEEDALSAHRKELKASVLVSALKQNLPILLASLSKKGTVDYGFFKIFAELGSDIIFRYCIKGFTSDRDENFISLYNDQIWALKESFEIAIGIKKTEDIFQRLTEHGYFVGLVADDISDER